MNQNIFGRRSKTELQTCHDDLIKIANLGLEISPIDFGIHQGGRSVEEQQEYYDNNKSRISPRDYPRLETLAQVANHIIIEDHPDYGKSRAFDFHISERHVGRSLAWDDLHLGIVIGCFFAAASQLRKESKISHGIRSGGDWDQDGIFVYDQKLKDLPHIELIKI